MGGRKTSARRGGLAMDETTLRKLLHDTVVHEPPIRPVAGNVLRKGIKLRRRRRALSAAGGVAVTA